MGIATQNPELRKRLDIKKATQQLENFLKQISYQACFTVKNMLVSNILHGEIISFSFFNLSEYYI